MLRSTTVAEIAALKERCGELRSQSMKPEAVDATREAVDIAVRQKQAQYGLELDRIRRSIIKSSTTRSMKAMVGDRVAAEQAIIDQEDAVKTPSYRDRTRSKRTRVANDLKAMLKSSLIQANPKLAGDMQRNLDKLIELNELDIIGPAQNRTTELEAMSQCNMSMCKYTAIPTITGPSLTDCYLHRSSLLPATDC